MHINKGCAFLMEDFSKKRSREVIGFSSACDYKKCG